VTARASSNPAALPARRTRTSAIALIAVFAALAAALGYALAWLPNVELLTFAVFASGVALGKWRGALVGALAMALYSGVNPQGSGLAVPPLFAAQIAGASLSGLAGGTTRGLWSGVGRTNLARGAVVGAALGLAVTVAYQVLVVAGYWAAMVRSESSLLAAVTAGGLFSVLHVVSNTVAFAVLAPAVLPRLTRRGTIPPR